MFGNGISRAASDDICEIVSRVLSDLGRQDPPLRLEDVRHLLELDRTYYSSDDHSLFRRAFHKMTIAGKQVVNRPGLIKDVVKKRQLRALWEPDARQILIDSELPDPKKRWAEAHEIGHSLLDWHETYLYGDPKRTLSIDCHIEIEAEANFAAGQLLFLGSTFEDCWLDSGRQLADIQNLRKLFGNSLTTTLWRAVECSVTDAFGLLCQHPRYLDEAKPSVDYLVQSSSFSQHFSGATADLLFEAVTPICEYRRRGPLGIGTVQVIDDNGEGSDFHVELFNNSYQTLVFGSMIRKRSEHTIVVG